MFQLPAFLAKVGTPFADPTKNGGLPTFGDALQGIGHDMAQHYRGAAGTPSAAAQSPPDPLAQLMSLFGNPPQQPAPTIGASPLMPIQPGAIPQAIPGIIPQGPSWGTGHTNFPMNSISRPF